MKYKPERDLVGAVRKLQTLNRDELLEYILNNFNKKLTRSAIDTWFNRNPEIKEMLDRELSKKIVGPEEEVPERLFEKGVFYWIDENGAINSNIERLSEYIKGKKRKRTVKPKTLIGYVERLRLFCLGVRPDVNPETQAPYRKGEWEKIKKKYREETGKEATRGIDLKQFGWTFKHPDRLNIDIVNNYLDLMIEHYPNVDTSGERLSLRNYFKYHEIKGVGQISGVKHKSAGKYADLKLPKETLFKMLDYMREKSLSFKDAYYQAYIACKFMYQTGTRISATLNAVLDRLNVVDVEVDGISKLVNVVVYDKGSLSKYGEQGQRWAKKITIDLFDEISLGADYPERQTGEIFRIDEVTLRDISRETIEKYAPHILKTFPDLKVIHFWRHMMGQHWLEATNYNYGIVAAMGGWTVKALEESYGKIPEDQLRELGAVYLPKVMEMK